MENKEDYYKVLGVSKDASEKQIQSAYRKAAIKWHPDMQSGKSDAERKAAEEKFKEIAEAYEVLSDKDKRARYDQFGFDRPKTGSPSGPGGFNMHDFMRQHASKFKGGFGNYGEYSSFFGPQDDEDDDSQQKPPNFNKPENGTDVQTRVELTFKEAVNGCEKSFDLKLSKECTDCHGSGIDESIKPTKCSTCKGRGRIVDIKQNGFMMSQTVSMCPDCDGTGYIIKYCKTCTGFKRIPDIKHIAIKIPAGIDDGQRIRIVGKGQCGVKYGTDGNLYINVSIKKQDIFERSGLNVKTNAYVDPITAMLGGKISVATPYKMIDVDIPAGTQTGKIIVKKNEGIKVGNSVGELHIEVCIEAFSKLSNDQKKALEEIKNKFTDDNLPLTKKYQEDAKQII